MKHPPRLGEDDAVRLLLGDGAPEVAVVALLALR